jgi:hypothetical protein
MPKFGSEKKVNTDVARESEVKPSVAKLSADGSKANGDLIRAPLADKNVGITRAAEKPPVRTTRRESGSGWVSEWGSKLSSLVSQRPKPARGAVPRSNGVAVQGELSLDNIKVVRNDLSDADLEVVTRKATPVDKDVGITAPERPLATLSAVNP